MKKLLIASLMIATSLTTAICVSFVQSETDNEKIERCTLRAKLAGNMVIGHQLGESLDETLKMYSDMPKVYRDIASRIYNENNLHKSSVMQSMLKDKAEIQVMDECMGLF